MSEKQGKVIRLLSPTELVINLGSSDGVTSSSRFIVFTLGDQMKDPDTGESLGQLEIVRGRAEAKHVQEKISTIRSIEKKKIQRDRQRVVPNDPIIPRIVPLFETVVEEVEISAPFEGVQVGDIVRVF